MNKSDFLTKEEDKLVDDILKAVNECKQFTPMHFACAFTSILMAAKTQTSWEDIEEKVAVIMKEIGKLEKKDE